MNQPTESPSALRSVLMEKTERRTGTLLQLADHTFQACDPIAEQLLGYRAEQIIGTTSFDPPWQTIHPNGSPFLPDSYPEVIALKTGVPCQEMTIGFYRPTGQLIWLEVSATPLFQAHNSEPYAALVALREANETQCSKPMPSESDRFRVLIEHASEFIALLTEDCHFSYVNDAFCERHGYTRDELRSLQGYDLNVNGSPEDFKQLWNAAQQQDSIRLDVQHQTKAGEKFDVDLTLKYIQFDHEAFLCGFGRDITGRKRSELMLIEQKRLLEFVASGQPLDNCLTEICHAVSALSPDTRACFLLADVQRRSFTRSITPDLPASFGQGLKDAPISEVYIGTCAEAVYCGKPVTCADILKDDRWAGEWRDLAIAHGIFACHSVPVIDRDNLPLGSLMLCFSQARMPTDWELELAEFGTHLASITFERDHALQNLRQSEERLQLGIQVSGIALARFDYASNTVALSSQAAALYGVLPNELTVSPDRLHATFHPEEASDFLSMIQQVSEADDDWSVGEFQIALKNGEVRWLNVRKQVFFDRSGEAPRPDYAILAAIDVTDRRRAEIEREHLLAEAQAARAEAEAANRSKDDFVAVVAHELRSPLNSISGWAKLLQIRKFDEAMTTKALDTIWRNTQTQVQMVEDLLDISRMIKGNLHLTIAPVDLGAVVEAAVNLVLPQAQAKQIQIDLQIELSPKVSGDFNRLQQIVVNLLTNAIKFTDEQGRVEVQVTSAGSQVQICVRDTGKGISPEFLSQIFERFRQGQQNTGSKDGLGLGLAIVKNLVELHGGSVKVESAGIGQGATFTVKLPLGSSGLEHCD
jgi:PAS domain S-box-containing protein